MRLYGIPGYKIDERSIFFYELWGYHSIVTALWFFAPRLGFRNNALLVFLASAVNDFRCAMTRGGSFAELQTTFLLQAASNLVVALLIAKDWFGIVKFELVLKIYAAIIMLACASNSLLPKTSLTKAYGLAPRASFQNVPLVNELHCHRFDSQDSKSRRISMRGGFGLSCSPSWPGAHSPGFTPNPLPWHAPSCGRSSRRSLSCRL